MVPTKQNFAGLPIVTDDRMPIGKVAIGTVVVGPPRVVDREPVLEDGGVHEVRVTVERSWRWLGTVFDLTSPHDVS